MEDFVYQVVQLQNQFYLDYPTTNYPEILSKKNRAYNCLLFETDYGYFICVPFRSNIVHRNAYHFKNSLRSQVSRSGLDYSKAVIITNGSYLESATAIIDKDEYLECIANIQKIARQAHKYVNDYVLHITGTKPMNLNTFRFKYGFSTLPYFHKELQIIHTQKG